MPSITRRSSPDPGRRAGVESDVLAATERLLTEGASFTELGVAAIAAEAGVARSTFYAHFRDKTDLIIRLATDMKDAVFGIASPWTTKDGAEALAVVYRTLLDAYRSHAAVLRAIAEVAAYDRAVRDFWGAVLAGFVEHTVALVRAEQEAGRTPPGIDAVAASRVIILGGERVLFEHAMTGAPADDAVVAETLALTWWHGVYRRPPA